MAVKIGKINNHDGGIINSADTIIMGDSVTAHGTNTMVNLAKNNSSITANITNGISQTELQELTKEFNEAINRINTITELQKEQREFLIELIKEAKTAIEENDENAKNLCKGKFATFKMWAGKAVDKIVPILSDLATIATFFGIGVSITK